MRWLLFSVVFILAFSMISFLYFATSTFPYPQPPRPAAIDALISDNNIPLNEDHVKYFLAQLEAHQLHNPPLSEETPKLLVEIGNERFGVEVTSGEIKVDPAIQEFDVIIRLSREEFIILLKSQEVRDSVKESFRSGKIQIEQRGSYSQLFSKGYLNLYNDLTGRTMTGNVVDIFDEED